MDAGRTNCGERRVSLIALAKERLTIPELARLRRWEWRPGKSCRCPYRPDRNESGSVFADGRLFRDFATGETLDAPALLARVENMSNEAACRLFIDLAGVKAGTDKPAFVHKPRVSNNEQQRKKPVLPALTKPTSTQLRQLANLRCLSIEGVRFAVTRGFLHATRFHDLECWTLTDSERWLCQLRRLDGNPFIKREGSEYKAQTCTGSWGAWPLGIAESTEFPSVALVEGGPDFLAACHFIVVEGMDCHTAPVGMLGAGQRIATSALPRFAGKRVRIFAHADEANNRGEIHGVEAAARWELQLRDAGADVTTFDLSGLTRVDGAPVKDLNDLARISGDDFEREPELSALMTF
jgi:hypothetical protein